MPLKITMYIVVPFYSILYNASVPYMTGFYYRFHFTAALNILAEEKKLCELV
jgi:hypothetical protein